MKILLTGGGTGGHITPILAVAESLKTKRPDCVTVYVGEQGSTFASLTDDNALLDEKYTVWAGKYRRYDGLSWWEKVTDLKTVLLNIRDFGFFLVGTVQAWALLGRVKPDVVFLKGGFVGVPVGLAAAMRRIPLVTHDSDAIPGLANRLVSKWVTVHAVAMPTDSYEYPASKTQQVGVLVEAAYQKVNAADKQVFRKQIGVPVEAAMILVTGGSLGAAAINKAVASCVDRLLTDFPELYVVHQVGKGKLGEYGSYTHKRLVVLEFLRPMHAYMGAADIVITRGSANTIAEIGVQAKPAIVIPSPYLANGHQMKNARLLQERHTAIVVQERDLYDDAKGLFAVTADLLSSPEDQKRLANALHKETPLHAADKLADVLIGIGA